MAKGNLWVEKGSSGFVALVTLLGGNLGLWKLSMTAYQRADVRRK